MDNSIIEISKKTSKAGRTPAKFVLHEIYNSDKLFNSNGISWKKEYVESCLDSVKSMPLVAQFLDADHTIPFGAHGELKSTDGKLSFEDSLVVGAFEDAYIDENLEVNGKTITGLVGKAYIFDQRFPELVTYLQDQYDNGNSVESSIEICANKDQGNSKIIYEDGWKEKGRIPKNYQYSGHALVIGCESADKSALMLELNTKKKEVDNLPNTNNIQIELNELDINDIGSLIENAFNKKFNKDREDYKYFYIHKFYPTISSFIMKSWCSTGEYYKSTYSVEGSNVIISDIIQVEESWKPVNGESPVEINNTLINIINNQTKEVTKKMDEKIVLELNKIIEEKTNEINSLNKATEIKATEINSLNTKVVDLEAKVSELSSTIVEINKSLESEKSEKEKVMAEVNTLKTEKEKVDLENKKVEVNAYFTTEIPKNGFEDAEVNSLKEYVEKCDLDGLMNAEKELVFKKFKESKVSVETNSTNNTSFIATKKVDETKKNSTIPTFFN